MPCLLLGSPWVLCPATSSSGLIEVDCWWRRQYLSWADIVAHGCVDAYLRTISNADPADHDRASSYPDSVANGRLSGTIMADRHLLINPEVPAY